jgi:hypothetical protein
MALSALSAGIAKGLPAGMGASITKALNLPAGAYLAGHDVSGFAASLIQHTAEGLTSAAVQAAIRGKVGQWHLLKPLTMSAKGLK